MSAWVPMSHSEEDEVWSQVDKLLEFEPRSFLKQTGINEPTPSVAYDISSIYSGTLESRQFLESDLNNKILRALRAAVPDGTRLRALDWQHPCYWFDPHADFDAKDSQAWQIPILPDGDYYMFLTDDLKTGIFGHYHYNTICIFGAPLIAAIKQDPPLVFTSVIRTNGQVIKPTNISTD